MFESTRFKFGIEICLHCSLVFFGAARLTLSIDDR